VIGEFGQSGVQDPVVHAGQELGVPPPVGGEPRRPGLSLALAMDVDAPESVESGHIGGYGVT